MADWWIEHGIGESRAALIQGGSIVEAVVEPEGMLRPGTILQARLVARLPERDQGIAAWAEGEALLRPLPTGVTQGSATLIEIVREPIGEPGKPKRALARPAAPGSEPRPGPTLAERLPEARPVPPVGPDLLEDAGWSAVLEEAATGAVAFPGGALRISLTPAMTLIDVDGTLAPALLMIRAADAAAQAIRRLGVAGSIGIDFPTVGDRQARQAAAQAIDGALPQPFERTAVNGFGFLQIVRPRARRSLLEVVAGDGALAWARALLRVAERTGGQGPRTLTAHPAVVAELARRRDWLAMLAQRIGAGAALQPDPALAIWAGHVQARFP